MTTTRTSAAGHTRTTILAVALVIVVIATVGCSSDQAGRKTSGTTAREVARPAGTAPIPTGAHTPELTRAPRYTSKDGTLHLRVKAEQVTSSVDAHSYPNIYTYNTVIIDGKGTFTAGTASAYVGPEWDVQPGDRVIVDYINALPDQSFQAVGAAAASAIPQPINLHTHGLTVSPAGNSDNVLLSIPRGRSNRYEFNIPDDQYEGLYWYHPHIHGITDDQVYEGLAGHIVVGRADGNYREFDGIATTPMMIRYNVAQPNAAGEMIDASPYDTRGTALEPRGKMIYTVNGQVAPSIKLNAADPGRGIEAESQVWAFTNITGSASYVLALEEVDTRDATNPQAVGRPVDFTIVGVDGTPMPTPKVLTGPAAARGYLLGQGSRVAVLVQGASDPSKVVRLIQVQNRSGTGDASAYNWPDKKAIGGWRDYTRDVLAISYNDATKPGRHVATPSTLTPNYAVVDQHLESATVTNQRTFVFNQVAPPSPTTPNNFPVDFALFPNNPIAQPKAGTVEEWTILNYSSLHHPFHVHTQYGKVMSITAPINPAYTDPPDEFPSVQYVTDLNQAAPADHTQDVVNIPPAKVGPDGMPILGPDGLPAEPGKAVLRVLFEDYLGTYVEHCHRLPHEDRGMMSMVRTIPNDPVLAIGGADADGRASVSVVRSSDDTVVKTITPFGDYRGTVSTAVGDIDGDAIADVAVASGAGMVSTVKIYSGSSGYVDVIKTFQPFEGSNTGATIATGDLNGDQHDDVVVGQSAGSTPRVVIFDGTTGNRLADFNAYDPGLRGGVSVAAGMVEAGGRISLLTAPGAGGPASVHQYNFDLFGDIDANMPDVHTTLKPLLVATFDGADQGYTGGLSITTGYPNASEGGFATVLTATLAGPVKVHTFTISDHHAGTVDVAVSGVALPHVYLPDAARTARAGPITDLGGIPGMDAGAWVATLSTLDGAELVVTPAGGGPATLWVATPGSGAFRLVRTLPTSGSRVAGI